MYKSHRVLAVAVTFTMLCLGGSTAFAGELSESKDLKDNKDGVFNILTRESLDDVAQIINSLEYSSLLSEKLIQEDYKKYALDPSNPKIKFE